MNSATDIRLIPVALAAALLALGAWLLILGLRGRRVGDHPTCARCGFDLRGAPEGSTRCPECGADTTARNVVRIGVRVRRPTLVAVGLFCFLIPTFAGVGTLTRIDWRSRLPTWYVFYEARSGSAASRATAIDELIHRDSNTPLDAEQNLALSRAMLAVLRDPNFVGGGPWLRWISTRLAGTALSEAERDALLANAFANTTLSLRPRAAEGKGLVVDVIGIDRWSYNSLPTKPFIDWANRSLTIDGNIVPLKSVHFGGRSDPPSEMDYDRILEDAIDPQTLPIGRHQIEYRIDVGISLQVNFGNFAAEPIFRRLGRREFRWSGTVEVVPAGEEVRLVRDPALAAAIRAAITVNELRQPHTDGGPSFLELSVTRLPMDIAFELFVQQGDGPEVRFQSMLRRANKAQGREILSAEPATIKPGKATVILRPSKRVAEFSADVVDIWGDEIRIEDVPVVESK